jgi:acyl-CoA thioester hydrolase
VAPSHAPTAFSPKEFSLPIVPRYAEVDQQGVVFNGHYLTWFDEAFTAFLDHVDVSYPDLIAAGLDVQVVHAEIDFVAPVRWRDAVRVTVACEELGTTSLTVTFSVLRRSAGEEEAVAVRGRSVYVVVSTSDWAKRPIPDNLRKVLS